MDFIQVISMPAIASIVYGIMAAIKATVKSDRFHDYIPIIAAAVGSVLGILFYIGFPEMIPAKNECAALIIGMASGLAATGANQTVKKIKKGGVDHD